VELTELDAVAQAELVRTGDASPIELVDAAIARIETLDPAIGALVDTRFERAREEAAGTLPDGPFRGVPMLVKDGVQHSEGDRYQHGMRYLRDRAYRSTEDSELVRRYRAAGFVILGRTKVPELTSATTTEPLAHGPAHNPWNLDHTTGGSSGGSGAAVAARMVPVAHGNDMGGSIRIPASCCGLVGLKPSRHRTSIFPHGEYWGPLTHEHVLTRTVRDSAAVLDATAGAVPGELHVAPPPARPWLDEVGAEPGSLRVGLVVDRPLGAPIDAVCAGAAQEVGDVLASLGHRVEPAAADPMHNADMGSFGAIVAAGLAAEVARWEREHDEPITDLEPMSVGMVDRGRAMSAVELIEAVDRLATWSHAVASAYEHYDLLVTPTLAVVPPRLGVMAPDADPTEMFAAFGGMTAFMTAFDATGQPAISLPTHQSPDGLPVGVQLVAAYGREDVVFRVAAQLEDALPWAGRAPRDP
jgi:amidase